MTQPLPPKQHYTRGSAGRALVSGIVAAVILTQVQQAAVAPGFDLQRLLRSADTVLVAETVRIEKLGKRDKEVHWLATVSVAKVLRGQNLTGPLTVQLRAVPHVTGRIVDGATYIMFLDKPEPHGSRPISDPYGVIRVSSHLSYDAIGAHLDLGEVVADLLRRSLEDRDSEVLLPALEHLTLMQTSVALTEARQLTKQDDLTVRARALCYRLSLGDYDDLEAAIQLIETHPDLDAFSRSGLLRYGVRKNDKVPVSVLNHWLASGQSLGLRTAAALVLGRRGDESSVPILVRSLLSSKGLSTQEKQLQLAAHIALSRLTGTAPEEPRAIFEDRQSVIDFWQRWWEENRVSWTGDPKNP